MVPPDLTILLSPPRVSPAHSLSAQHFQPCPRFLQQSIHGGSGQGYYAPPPRIGRGRDERLAGRVRVAWASAHARRIIAGAAGESSCTGGPRGGCPMVRAVRRQSARTIAQAVGRPRARRCQVGRPGDDPPSEPGCGVGRKSLIPPTTGVDCRPAPPPDPRDAQRAFKGNRAALRANVRLATGCLALPANP